MSDKERVVRQLDAMDWRSINRLGDQLLDPRQHAYEPTPYITTCARCHCPRADHKTWPWRLIARVLKWRG